MYSSHPSLPPELACIQRVASFEELIDTPFSGAVNALCWPRVLPGDFTEVMALLLPSLGTGIQPLDEEELRALPLTPAGRLAVEAMLGDLHRLQDLGLQPELNAIVGQERAPDTGLFRRDVASFHVDSATVEADTFLCTYLGPCSEGLRAEDALPHMEVPEIRAALLASFEGAEGPEFQDWLQEHFYDLHYTALPGAQPYAFGRFHLWRIATEHPTVAVPPCIHRAPETLPGDPPRLLLIS